MKRTCFLLLILLCCIANFASAKPRLEIERDIREAVFRHQFKRYASDHHKIYFLAIGWKHTDPSDEFMKRFANHRPPVKKVSQSVRGQHSVVKDKVTGEHGLIFCTNEIKWLSPSQAKIEGGYNAANLSASHNTYIVEKQGEKWVVIKDTIQSVA